MITKKHAVLVFILFLFIIGLLTAQNSDAELTVSRDETENEKEYVSVSEESLVISDAADPEVLENTAALNTFTVWDFVRMLLVLGAVLGFIYLLFFLLKKAGKPKIISDSTIN
ncbi:MAG: hypothetical protein U9N32_06290, partial [Spirochaetota bacterium]|nr:hypothetical protein [Spirochaetota bacterium]